METLTVAKIEESIFALPTEEQKRLIARVSRALRRQDASVDKELSEMANDPDIRREIEQIDEEFRPTEMDGLRK